MLNYYPRTKSS